MELERPHSFTCAKFLRADDLCLSAGSGVKSYLQYTFLNFLFEEYVSFLLSCIQAVIFEVFIEQQVCHLT